MDLGLHDKVAVVTGGVGGIGRAIASTLLAEGCHVHIADMSVDGADGVEEFRQPRAHLRSLDVGDARAVDEAMQAIANAQGRLDILVNCAGILKTQSLIDSTIEDWDQVCRVNLSGTYYCSKSVLPIMVEQRYGKILNIASISSVKGGGAFGNVLYGTTKAGVVAFTQGFARELAPFGINVNAISPGVIDGPSMITGLMTPQTRQQLIANIPIRRLIDTAEIARLTAFLVSDISQAITGQVVVIDGGYLVR